MYSKHKIAIAAVGTRTADNSEKLLQKLFFSARGISLLTLWVS